MTMHPASYNVKIIATPEDWLCNPSVAQIHSVSECLSHSAIDHFAHWQFNNYQLYDSERILEDVLRKAKTEDPNIQLFYYEVHEEYICEGTWGPITDFPENVQKPAQGYTLKGYDIVSFSDENIPECSPLSCNSGAEHNPVNQFCLVDDIETALQYAQPFDDGKYEPGPYRIMSVWQKNV